MNVFKTAPPRRGPESAAFGSKYDDKKQSNCEVLLIEVYSRENLVAEEPNEVYEEWGESNRSVSIYHRPIPSSNERSIDRFKEVPAYMGEVEAVWWI